MAAPFRLSPIRSIRNNARMSDHQYQVVVEFSATTAEQFDRLQDLEGALEFGFAEDPEVLLDGHDFGMGFFNIFLHTNVPEKTFRKTLALIQSVQPDVEVRAGYRDFAEEEYVPLHPAGLKSFDLR
jgi:hypothetical protein